MNQLKSGTLFVVIATIVTAILILTTSRDEITTAKDKAVIVEESNNPTIEETLVIIESTAVSKRNIDEVQTAMNTISEAIEIKAPEGSFNKAGKDTIHAESLETTNDVNNAQAQLIPAIKLASIKAVTTSTQHDLLNHIIQPIWMDQKLGDFKSVEKDKVAYKIMPTNPNGLQGENPKRVVTSKSDKFAPTTVSADYNYQQMPMYNGGYYIAPMPPYLMPSVLPQSTINKDL